MNGAVVLLSGGYITPTVIRGERRARARGVVDRGTRLILSARRDAEGARPLSDPSYRIASLRVSSREFAR